MLLLKLKVGVWVFFRFYLNHAIAIAKKEGISKITLEAENEKLKEYYSKFGFKFMGLNGERKI
jgi:ribosomal protein S18 acetylase RimI-like enzyme